MKKILYLGWIGFRNVGDELMWELFLRHGKERWKSEHYEIVPSVPGVPYKQVEAYDAVVLGGGSLLIPGYLDLLHRAVLAGKPVWVWGSGYDGMEKVPSKQLAVYQGVLREKLIDIAKRADYFGVRGPFTYQALADSGIPMERVKISGDPGMLLHHERKAADGRGKTGQVIGINWGTAYNKVYGGNEKRVEAALAAAAKRWIRQGYQVWIYPVWGPDLDACKSLAARIDEPGNVTVVNRILSAGELMPLVEGCLFTVNFKLHANIISHAAGVPFVCLGYRFKCFDYVYSVDMPDFIVPMDAADLEERLLQAASRAVSSRNGIVSALRRRQEDYRERVMKSFLESPLL